MRLRWLGNERGTVLLFVTALLVMLFVFAGIAIDLTYHASVRGELQRSVDAAALAGAGKLGFDDSVFPTVRQWARDYALRNPFRNSDPNSNGLVTLNLNEENAYPDLSTVNAPYGDIVLGVWENGNFTPSLDGSVVNAVRCRYVTQSPSWLLQFLGFNSFRIAVQGTAISNPPQTAGCGAPVLPLAVTKCTFKDGNTGAFNNSTGCGTGITFIRSQTLCNNSPSSPQQCNTGTWASLDGSTPNVPYLRNAIQNAASGTCNQTTLATGDTTTANNGMLDTVFGTLADVFKDKYGPLPDEDGDGSPDPIRNSEGDPIIGTDGQPLDHGWKVGVMMIETECPPGPLSNEFTVLTYHYFVITQVYYRKDKCVVENRDPQAAPYCDSDDPELRAVFGYFVCDRFGTVATLDPVPRAALAPRIRLVR